MTEVLKDVNKHVTAPIKKFVSHNQKRIRHKAIQILDDPKEHHEPSDDGGRWDSPSFKPGKKKLENGAHSGFVLECLRHWDVTMPPVRKYKVGGHMVQGVKNTVSKIGWGKLLNKKRRITIELYKKSTPKQEEHSAEHQTRVFQKLHPRASIDESTMEHENDLPPLGEEDYIIFRILKQARRKGDHKSLFDFDDDDSQSTASRHLPNGAFEAHSLTTYNINDYGDGFDESQVTFRWKERYRSRISSMEIQNVESRMIEIQLGVADDVILRDFCFDNSHEVETFLRVFEKMTELQHERGSRLAAQHRTDPERGLFSNHALVGAMLGSTPENKPIGEGKGNGNGVIDNPSSSSLFSSRRKEKALPNSVNLLIEIVSAKNLPIAGKKENFLAGVQ